MSTPIVGLHHVTAIASDPQSNLDFYTQVLGLRFVKRTINFDDPGTYHFYFGNDVGAPGTILTFFPWPNAGKGRVGAGEVIATAFSIPIGSFDFWAERLKSNAVSFTESERFGSRVITLSDPDGMVVELVEHEEKQPTNASRYSDIEPRNAIQGFYGVALLERSLARTEQVLRLMGLNKIAEENGVVRFAPEGAAVGRFIDIKVDAAAPLGRMGAGTVHHIAFRNVDDAAQAQWRQILSAHLSVTPVQDRTYFHSIYFREPGGVLFEMATDNPGFLIDEPVESLGEALRIPDSYEPMRQAIEAHLTPLKFRTSSSSLVGVTQ
ncbi:MAG TPA: ring-cleaving dioxygenase [Bryobacteraceae bacterium]|nr:ring-cleaving dioxygenase [Bryobacteraceae bacterium]